MGYPELSLDDLYLMDGNPLLANLGQQSRELVELLLRNWVDVDGSGDIFNLENQSIQPTSALELIQNDIRNLTNRLEPTLRLSENTGQYVLPVDGFAQDESIQIQVCHNRMREVQTMYNQVAKELQTNPSGLKLNEILITAPDIDDYAPYIQAVFGEEYLLSNDNRQIKIPYNITGNRQLKFVSLLTTVQQFLNVPYQLPVSYLLDILADANIMHNFELSEADVELIKRWLSDNNTHLGYDQHDYQELDIAESDLYSLKRLINNLTLGLCIPALVTQASAADDLAIYNGEYPAVAYDNLDFAESHILGKLNIIVSLLVDTRNQFYVDATNYQALPITKITEILNSLKSTIFTSPEDCNQIDEFIKTLLVNSAEKINLAIINRLIEDYLSANKGMIRFNGSLTCASLQNMRNLPFKLIYILGLNFGEYPRAYSPNQLSFLSRTWYLGDRNYTLEDKQVFLDTVLAAKDKLILSYVGRSETDNQKLEPSSVLSLFQEVIVNSFNDGQEYLHQISQFNALHPFYHNAPVEYSGYWAQVIGLASNSFEDKRWSFANKISLNNLAEERRSKLLEPNITDIINSLLYTNNSLKKVLQITDYDNEIELDDYEPYQLSSYELAQKLYSAFEQIGLSRLQTMYSEGNLLAYLQTLGILSDQSLGQIQLDNYYLLYGLYAGYTQGEKYSFSLVTEAGINLIGNLKLLNNVYYVLPKFNGVKFQPPSKSSVFPLKLRANYLVWSLVLNNPLIQFFDVNGGEVKLTPQVEVISFEYDADLSSKFMAKRSQLSIKDSTLAWNMLLDYYTNSLTSRTLFHKSAIEKYLAQVKGDSPETAMISSLYNGFNNYQLDDLRNDPLWGNEIDDYANLVKEYQVNPLLDLAKLYEQVVI